jgi:5S rRNA maturation endonuclease (ribonuclease M5)
MMAQNSESTLALDRSAQPFPSRLPPCALWRRRGGAAARMQRSAAPRLVAVQVPRRHALHATRAAASPAGATLSCGAALDTRRRRRQPPTAPQAAVVVSSTAPFTRPVLCELVVVEGPRDADAVRQAVTCDVAVTNGTPPRGERTRAYDMPPAALTAVLAAAGTRGAIVLSDPDPGGRAMRAAMHALLAARPSGAISHAFLPRSCCECRSGSHAGDAGVQYARPGAVRAALAGARPRDEARNEFTRDDLLSWGLAGTHGEAPPARYVAMGGVAARRDAVASQLGFGPCEGRIFLKYANAYGFTRAEVEAAVAALDAQPATEG